MKTKASNSFSCAHFDKFIARIAHHEVLIWFRLNLEIVLSETIYQQKSWLTTALLVIDLER